MIIEAIGGSLPMAVGVALSPVPVAAVIIMLMTAQARTNAPTFPRPSLLLFQAKEYGYKPVCTGMVERFCGLNRWGAYAHVISCDGPHGVQRNEG